MSSISVGRIAVTLEIGLLSVFCLVHQDQEPASKSDRPQEA